MGYDPTRHDEAGVGMKSCTVAVMILGLLAMPAQAQLGEKRNRGDAKKTEEKKWQLEEADYRRALDRTPEPKGKYDPWGLARRADTAKKTR